MNKNLWVDEQYILELIEALKELNWGAIFAVTDDNRPTQTIKISNSVLSSSSITYIKIQSLDDLDKLKKNFIDAIIILERSEEKENEWIIQKYDVKLVENRLLFRKCGE